VPLWSGPAEADLLQRLPHGQPHRRFLRLTTGPVRLPCWERALLRLSPVGLSRQVSGARLTPEGVPGHQRRGRSRPHRRHCGSETGDALEVIDQASNLA
jgi:hypothetical protein